MTYPPQYQQPYAPVPPPVDRKREIRKALVIAGVAIVACLVVFAVLWFSAPQDKAGRFTLSACRVTSASLNVATASFTITNTTGSTQSATLAIEYRDATGAKLDTDTAYVRGIAPGDTVRRDEPTLLDGAPAGSITCAITSIT